MYLVLHGVCFHFKWFIFFYSFIVFLGFPDYLLGILGDTDLETLSENFTGPLTQFIIPLWGDISTCCRAVAKTECGLQYCQLSPPLWRHMCVLNTFYLLSFHLTVTYFPLWRVIFKPILAFISITIPPLWDISLSFLDASKNSVSVVWQVQFDHLGSGLFLFITPDIYLVEYYMCSF